MRLSRRSLLGGIAAAPFAQALPPPSPPVLIAAAIRGLPMFALEPGAITATELLDIQAAREAISRAYFAELFKDLRA